VQQLSSRGFDSTSGPPRPGKSAVPLSQNKYKFVYKMAMERLFNLCQLIVATTSNLFENDQPPAASPTDTGYWRAAAGPWQTPHFL
jgi:hypothetical protein